MTNDQKRGPNATVALVLHFLLKALPLLISGGSIYLGYRLFILGVTGKASLSVHTETVSGQLLNAAPGLFFAVDGLVALIIAIWKGTNLALYGSWGGALASGMP